MPSLYFIQPCPSQSFRMRGYRYKPSEFYLTIYQQSIIQMPVPILRIRGNRPGELYLVLYRYLLTIASTGTNLEDPGKQTGANCRYLVIYQQLIIQVPVPILRIRGNRPGELYLDIYWYLLTIDHSNTGTGTNLEDPGKQTGANCRYLVIYQQSNIQVPSQAFYYDPQHYFSPTVSISHLSMLVDG
jgi:hypothetical protein